MNAARMGWLAGCALVLLSVLADAGGASAPPSRDQMRLGALVRQLNRDVFAGRFAEAAKAAKLIEGLWKKAQGQKHWQTTDARYETQRWGRLAKLSAEKGRAIGQAFRHVDRGNGWQARQRYSQAFSEYNKALRLYLDALGEQHPEMVVGHNSVASCLQDLGKQKEALTLYQKALTIRKKALGEDHRFTGDSYNNMAFCHSALGKHTEALPLFKKALEIRRKALGEEHPDTAGSYNNVASCLNARGKPGEALPLYQKALEIWKKALGEQHPHTAGSYSNVAVCLYAQGKHTEARPLFQKALTIRQKVLGELHPDTAASSNNLAYCLNAQGKHGEALPLFQKALEISRKALGEDHPTTAIRYHNVASCLKAQRKYGEALPLYKKILEIRQKALGEAHPDTAISYNNAAGCLHDLGKHNEALPLYKKALAINQKALGEAHPDTATCYNCVAVSLDAQGKSTESLLLHQKALSIRRKALGEQHPATAVSYSNVAACLYVQGRHREALPLFRKALGIRQRALGQSHPDTANSYGSVASCLKAQGKYNEALPLFKNALAIHQKALGEAHTRTATSYDNLASCLKELGRHKEALSLSQKALLIRQKVLGENHPHIASSYSSVALCLNAQGKSGDALLLYKKALAIRRKVLGEDHPLTANSYYNVAFCLHDMGKNGEALPLVKKASEINKKVRGAAHSHTAACYTHLARCLHALGKHQEAIAHWKKALVGYDLARLDSAASGFDRSLFGFRSLAPRRALALALAAQGKPREAWQYAEGHLARGLLDDLMAHKAQDDARTMARLRRLEAALVPLLGGGELNKEEKARCHRLARERDSLLAEMGQRRATLSAKLVLGLEDVQKQIPTDAALVFWLDNALGSWACVLRRQGEPHWVRLPGSGKKGTWTREDNSLPARAYQALLDPEVGATARTRLLLALHKQRLGPLGKYLKARGRLPAAKHLVVVPTGAMAEVPVEALTADCTVSYAPSASVFARLMKQHRALKATSLLAVGDPAFSAGRKLPDAPKYGLLIRLVLPGGACARAGFRPGDALLAYNAVKLKSVKNLKLSSEAVRAVVWRDGKRIAVRLAGGRLGISVDTRLAPEAVRAWRESERLDRGKSYQPLPGTRQEVRALARLIPRATALLGSAASESVLIRLAKEGWLKGYRILHFATHGEVNKARAGQSALILAQDKLATMVTDAAEEVLRTGKVIDGRLTVDTIRKTWELDADLVVLSACDTAQGKDAGGEGLLGFAQALLSKGARSVVLSRWKVDDAATTLLMVRFYENLLGKRKGLNKALPRAEALAEAKKWLRTLPRKDAERLAVRLAGGVLRGTIDSALPEAKARKGKAKLPKGDRPFSHPRYWAAFVLIGDPF